MTHAFNFAAKLAAAPQAMNMNDNGAPQAGDMGDNLNAQVNLAHKIVGQGKAKYPYNAGAPYQPPVQAAGVRNNPAAPPLKAPAPVLGKAGSLIAFGAKLAASSCAPCDMPNSPTNKKHMTSASPAVTEADEHSEEIGKPEVVETEHSEAEAKQPEEGIKSAKLGLWDRIRAKKERGGKAANPGDKDYPDSKSWKKVTAISKKSAAQLGTKLAAEPSRWAFDGQGSGDAQARAAIYNAVKGFGDKLPKPSSSYAYGPGGGGASGPDLSGVVKAINSAGVNPAAYGAAPSHGPMGKELSLPSLSLGGFGKSLGTPNVDFDSSGPQFATPKTKPAQSAPASGESPASADPASDKPKPEAPGMLSQALELMGKNLGYTAAGGLGALGLGGALYYATRPKKKNKEEEEVKSASGFGKFLGKMMGAAATPAANVAGDAAKGVKRFGTGAQLPAPALPPAPPISGNGMVGGKWTGAESINPANVPIPRGQMRPNGFSESDIRAAQGANLQPVRRSSGTDTIKSLAGPRSPAAPALKPAPAMVKTQSVNELAKSASGFGKMLGGLMKTPAQAGQSAMMAARNNLKIKPGATHPHTDFLIKADRNKFLLNPDQRTKPLSWAASGLPGKPTHYSIGPDILPRRDALSSVGRTAARNQALTQGGVVGGAAGLGALSQADQQAPTLEVKAKPKPAVPGVAGQAQNFLGALKGIK